jgi:hypothetical protein
VSEGIMKPPDGSIALNMKQDTKLWLQYYFVAGAFCAVLKQM